MATVLADITDLARHETFVWRVSAATVKAAVAVGGEPYDGSQYRIMRRALATKVFEAAELWGEHFTWGVAANSTISFDSSDSDIEWTVSSLWDAYAGAYPPPTEPTAEQPAPVTPDVNPR